MTTPATDADESPLSPEQQVMLRRGARAYGAIKRTGSMAMFSAVSTLIVSAALVPVLLIFPDPVATPAVLLVLTAGIVEYIGRRKLKQAKRGALTLLAFNQLFLLGVIAAYCVGSVIVAAIRFDPALFSQDVLDATKPLFDVFGMPNTTASLKTIVIGLLILVKGVFLVLSVFFQGGMALFYWTRRKHFETYHANTPTWVKRVIADVA